MRARILSSIARVLAATALLFVIGLNARPADAQYCMYITYGCSSYGYGGYGYGGYGYGYPYSYYSAYGYGGYGAYGGYPYSYYGNSYYGLPYGYPGSLAGVVGTPAYGIYNSPFGAYPYFGYPTYTNSAINFGYYGTPFRGYYGLGYSSIYGLPTVSMFAPWISQMSGPDDYCFPC